MFLRLLLGLLFGTLCADQAKKRGRNPIGWFGLGLIFGIFALAALFLLPRLNPSEIIEVSSGKKPEGALQEDKKITAPPYVGDPRCRQWFFLDDQRSQKGPLPFRNLHAAWDEKQLSLDTYVWTEGMVEWKQIRSVPSLLERFQIFS